MVNREGTLYIDDIVSANIFAAKSDIEFGIYNIGTGVNYSINQIADFINGKRDYIDERPAEVRETLADISDTIRDLSWKPIYSLDEMILSY